MSSDGIRKQTKGWAISPSGQMVNITGGVDGIVVDEGLPVTDSAVVKTEPPPLPGMPKAAPAPLPPPRERKSTLDTFNDEMAVLERPLEGDVEYVDEAPPPSRWRRVGLFAGIVIGMGLGGGIVLSRRHATVETPAQAAQAAKPAGATSPATLAAAATATQEAAAAPAAPAVDEGAGEAGADDGAAPAAKSAWSKVHTKTGHSKHARSSSGKTTSRRVTTTHHKRTSRHH